MIGKANGARIGITGLGVHVPAKVVTNDDLAGPGSYAETVSANARARFMYEKTLFVSGVSSALPQPFLDVRDALRTLAPSLPDGLREVAGRVVF